VRSGGHDRPAACYVAPEPVRASGWGFFSFRGGEYQKPRRLLRDSGARFFSRASDSSWVSVARSCRTNQGDRQGRGAEMTNVQSAPGRRSSVSRSSKAFSKQSAAHNFWRHSFHNSAHNIRRLSGQGYVGFKRTWVGRFVKAQPHSYLTAMRGN